MSLTAVAFWIVYGGGVCAAVLNPVVGVVLYVLVYHLNPETQWWGASVQAAGLRTSFTVALATGIGMLLRWPRLAPGARQFPLPMVLAVLFALLAVGSLAWGVQITPRGLYQAQKLVKVLIFVFMLVRCVRTPLHYQAVIVGWLIGVLYVGYEAQGGVARTAQGRLSSGLGGPDFAESSDLAVHLVATLPLVGAVFFMVRTWLGRGLTLLTGALAVNTLIMTRTRNALAGLALVTLGCVLALPRGYRVRGVLAVIAGTLLAVQLTDPGWWRRMETITRYHVDGSATARIVYWQAALQMVADHPFGIGLGNFHHLVMEYVPGLNMIRGAHNTFLACLAELGWPGLGVFVLLLAVTFRRLGRLRRAARDLPDLVDIVLFGRRSRFHLGWHAVALRAGLLGYLGCGLFTTRLYSEDLWLLLGLAMCLSNVSMQIRAACAHATEPRAAAAPHAGPPAVRGADPRPARG